MLYSSVPIVARCTCQIRQCTPGNKESVFVQHGQWQRIACNTLVISTVCIRFSCIHTIACLSNIISSSCPGVFNDSFIINAERSVFKCCPNVTM